MKTTDLVGDMESIRKALGAGKINNYGFSYGTYLGQVYSTLRPDRVRRMVWDGVVNPVDVWYDANLNQDIQFDKNIKIYFDWIAKHDDAYLLTGALPARLSGNRSDVQCEPVPPPDPAPAAGAAAKAGSGSAIQDRLPADLRQIITRASPTG